MSAPGHLEAAELQCDLYFFLSFARLGPLLSGSSAQAPGWRQGRTAGRLKDYGPATDADFEVRKFFEELDAEIVQRTRRRAPSGFYDRHIRFDADPRTAMSDALGRAQVFVPLYSPSYLSTSWTRRERNAFRLRMMRQHLDPDSRMLPVLWTPVPSWTIDPDDRQPLERACALSDVTAYPKNGLRALCLLPIYADAYRQVLDRVATEIIRIAETTPVPPVVALDLDQPSDASTKDPSFVITVLAGGSEVTAARLWHPYSDRQKLPLAEYARRIAERFGLAPSVVEFDHFVEDTENNPGLAVVDPRILRHADGEDRLRRAFSDLPVWVRPLVVGDSEDAAVACLTDRAQEILAESVSVSSEWKVRDVARVDCPQDLENKLPLALAQTRQAYLRYGSFSISPSLVRRPRLAGGGDEPPNGRESDVYH